MPGSPLKKNYVHEIKSSSSYLDHIISQTQMTDRVRKHKASEI